MSVATIATRKLFGLFELNATGTVLYSRLEHETKPAPFSPEITGCNFYTEVAPFKNVNDFRQCIESFRNGAQQASSIKFTCDYDDGPTVVKVLLARIHERAEKNVTKSVLVHIRKAL